MINTGVDAIDSRLGSLPGGRTYVLVGPRSSGKSVLGLHFLMTGLERGEHVCIVTADEASSIDGRAMFMGYGPSLFTEHPNVRLVRLPGVLRGGLGVASADAAEHWLAHRLGSVRPARMLIDATALHEEPVAGGNPDDIAAALARAADRLGATTFALMRSDGAAASFEDAESAPLLANAAGVFRLRVTQRGQRTLLLDRVPVTAFRTDPFDYSLKVGAGFSEELALAPRTLEPAERNRLLILDETGALPADVRDALGPRFDVVELHSTAGSLGELSAGRYGALVATVDPFDEARTLDLVFMLRKEGNAAPIVLVAPSSGLRSTTRARGLRMGGDDFFVTDLPAAEIVERIQLAWLRGTHRRTAESQASQVVQPVDATGLPRLMTETELVGSVQQLLGEESPRFFCYLEFRTLSIPSVLWPSLRGAIRVGEGDIAGVLGDGRFACVLDRTTPEQTAQVVERIRAGHPGLRELTDVVILPSPIQAADIGARLQRAGVAGSVAGSTV